MKTWFQLVRYYMSSRSLYCLISEYWKVDQNHTSLKTWFQVVWYYMSSRNLYCFISEYWKVRSKPHLFYIMIVSIYFCQKWFTGIKLWSHRFTASLEPLNFHPTPREGGREGGYICIPFKVLSRWHISSSMKKSHTCSYYFMIITRFCFNNSWCRNYN